MRIWNQVHAQFPAPAFPFRKKNLLGKFATLLLSVSVCQQEKHASGPSLFQHLGGIINW